uniref:Uncharacterized protein n=1 Tax=Tetraselmis sp. GSL018 TaxID=582737 RepID=A0A061R5K9_9CHLO
MVAGPPLEHCQFRVEEVQVAGEGSALQEGGARLCARRAEVWRRFAHRGHRPGVQPPRRGGARR